MRALGAVVLRDCVDAIALFEMLLRHPLHVLFDDRCGLGIPCANAAGAARAMPMAAERTLAAMRGLFTGELLERWWRREVRPDFDKGYAAAAMPL